ncbi:CHAT domain-containing protein [Rhodovulum strictum]|uniref:CHAT domain-containing protein n=1 Tax=Rhodovulum strictum TaxID=58314 RepID=A0A844BIC9_9RHOB|nr:CHAT domain-containing protein [Rhodovulum strictum]MRH20723.1 CHAT domain-containing protein [Rhodovulum strictum]
MPNAAALGDSELDWSGFDRACMPAHLEAARIVAALMAGGQGPAPERLAADAAGQVALRLRQRQLSGHALPPGAVAYAEAVGARAAALGRGADTAPGDAFTRALLQVNALMAPGMAAGEAEAALADLARAEERLEAIGAAGSPREAAELEDYRALIQSARGRALVLAGRHDEAERAFWAIVALREASSVTHDALFAEVIAYVDRFGARYPDRALSRLIPLVRHSLADLALPERVVLLMTLADLYRGVGDVAGARHLVEDAAGTLAEAGLPLPETAPPQAVLDAVAALSLVPLNGQPPGATERFARFSGVMTALMKRANILRQSSEAGQVHLAAFQRLSDLGDRAMARSAALAAEPDPDEVHIAAALADADLTAPPPLPYVPLDLGASRRLDALADRAEAEGASVALAAELEALAEDPGLQPVLAAQALTQAAGMWADLGVPERASGDYRRAARIAQQADDLWQDIQAVLGLSLLPDDTHPPERKRADLRALVERIEARRARLNAAYLPSAFMADKVLPYLAAAHMAGKAGDHAERLRLLDRLRAQEIHGPPLAAPATDPLRREVIALSGRLRAEPDPERAARLRIERRLAWDELMIARPRLRPDFELAALQARLGGAAVLSAFFMAPDVLDLTLITAGEVVQVRRLLSEWPDFAARLAAVLQPSRLSLDLPAHLAALADILLPEAFRPALAAAPELAIVPHRALHGLPWGALPLDGQPLILGRPVATVPNLTALTRPGRCWPAAPRFLGVATRSTTATDAAGRRLIDLPQAEAEARAAAAQFRHGATLLGAGATRAAFLSDPRLGAADTVLVALHGTDVADPALARAPMETTLALCDGAIDGIDLACLALSAGLVVSTACYSGRRAARIEGLETLPADALYGLQAAFLLAGAGAVLAPLWRAGDATAHRIAGHLFEALGQGARPAEALHRAIRAYLDSPGLRRVERDPYAWAPYALCAFSPAIFAFGSQGES